ncbi:MAG: SMC family ATPase, partial [Bryobacterales bacterium]|nr:SMC family ATPase [Bryobacterales bacterium]
MRPVKLKVEGFTCYRVAQEIDFARLRLFAISGPTGSGKSSLLDAITFALYGKVPRLGGQNLDEFVSLGASRAVVTLDFEVQGKQYRVVRTMRPGAAKRAQLEEIGGVTLGDQIGDVNEKVEALLGLKYDAFVQSVLLPQGDFAKFLKSKPAEQRNTLRELLRLGVYERMRELAAKEAGELQAKIDAARDMLNGPYAGATEKNLEGKEASLLAARGQRDEVAMEVEKLRGEFDRVRKLRAQVEERDQLRARQTEIERKQPEMDAARQEIERAERAAAVIELLDEAAAKGNAVQALRHSASELEAKLAKASKDVDVKAAALREAEAEAAALPVKRERVLKLAAVIPAAKERADWTAKLAALRKRRDKLREDVAKQQTAFEKASADLQPAQTHRDELRQKRAGVDYDAAVHTILANARAAVFALSSARENEQNSVAPLAAARKAEEEASAALHEKEQALKLAEDALERAERKLLDAAGALEAMQNQHRAAVLRAKLEPGCTCPVCEQPVKKVPASAAPAALQEAEQKKRDAEGEKGVVAKRSDAARKAMMRAQAASDAARSRVLECEAMARNARRKLEESERVLQAAIAPFVAPADVLLEVFAEQEFAAHDQRKKQFDELTNELAAAERGADQARAKAALLEAGVLAHRKEITGLDADIEEAERKIEEYGAKVDAVGSEDPEQESQQIQAEITRIEQRRERNKKAHDGAMQTRHAAEVESAQKRAEL